MGRYVNGVIAPDALNSEVFNGWLLTTNEPGEEVHYYEFSEAPRPRFPFPNTYLSSCQKLLHPGSIKGVEVGSSNLSYCAACLREHPHTEPFVVVWLGVDL